MSTTTTLTFSFRVGTPPGTLTDLANPPTLSDPTAAYGVRRADNNAIVVAAGTPMVHQSTGVYTYTFTDPADALTYQWFAEWVNPASVTQWSQFTATGGTSANISGTYWTQSGVQAIYGQYNVAQDTQLNNDDATNVLVTATLQAHGNAVDNDINRMIAQEGWTAPLSPTSNSMPIFQDIGNELLKIRLDRSRPQPGDAAAYAALKEQESQARRRLLGMLRSVAGIDGVRSRSPAVTVYDPRPQARVDGYPVEVVRPGWGLGCGVGVGWW